MTDGVLRAGYDACSTASNHAMAPPLPPD